MSTLAPTQASFANDPARVLIVGDSVTQGNRGDFTWRYFAWKALEQSGAAVDFVGTRTGTFDIHDDGRWDWNYNETDAYADAAFDQDHSAFYGGRMGPDDNFFYEPIEQTVAATMPDVIVSMWGINDLWHKNDGPAEVTEIYRKWIASARSVKPDVDFVIGELPYVWNDEVPAFNALIRSLAVEESTDLSHIVTARMQEPYTQEGDSLDNVHPNTEGQRKIAGMVTDALSVLLAELATAASDPAVTTPIQIPPAPPAPPPEAAPEEVIQAIAESTRPTTPKRVRADRVSGSVRTVVRWRKVADAERYDVRCGAYAKEVQGRSVTLRSRSTRCRVRSANAVGSSAWVVARVDDEARQ